MNTEVKDQYIAATLLYYLGSAFKGPVIKDSSRGHKEVWFVFDDQKLCEEIMHHYHADLLTVNPREFSACLTRVREMYKQV